MPKGSNCSNVRIFQKIELFECSNCSMLKSSNCLMFELLKCSICSMLKALPQKIAQKALCLVKIQNSKIQNCGKAATIQNSKFKIQKSPLNLLYLVNVSVERSAMFELQRTHGGSKLARLCYALAL